MPLDFLKTAPGADPIVVEAWVPAPPPKVYSAFTKSDKVRQWFGKTPNSLHTAEIDLRKGGLYKFLWKQDDDSFMGFTGAYLDLDEPDHLAFSWQQIRIALDGAEDLSDRSRVDVNFTVKGAGTDILLRHSGVTSDQARQGIGGGWNTGFGHLVNLF